MKKYLAFVILFLITGSSFPVFGQDVAINRPIAGERLKSVSQARSIALSNTVLSVGTGVATVALFNNGTLKTTGAILGVYGILMAPSTGNFYANDYPRGVIGMGVRAVGSFLMIDATSEIFGREFASALNVDDKNVSLTDTKILIGEALVLGSIIYNVLSSKASVEDYNSGEKKFGLNVAPRVVDDKVAPVLTASFSF